MGQRSRLGTNTRPLNFTCTLALVVGCITAEPFESWSTLDLGYNFNAWGSNGALMWETDFHYEDDGSETCWPALRVLEYQRHSALSDRVEHDFHDRQGVMDHGNGDVLSSASVSFFRPKPLHAFPKRTTQTGLLKMLM